MLSYLEALARVLEVARHNQLSAERVSLLDAVGRTAAETLRSAEPIPPFANSAMDGFAVKSELTRTANPHAPLRFKVVGSVAAGDGPPTDPPQDGAWEIMTGAPFPQGFDASVKIEDVHVTRNASGGAVEIEINSPVSPQQNWRSPGEDFQIGTVVLERGRLIQPEHVLALSSLGLVEISVVRRLRVGVISTGRELVPMEQTPGPGQIRNSTAPFLIASLGRLGVEAIHLGTILDEPEKFQDLMKRVARETFDLILTTGAVSMGKYDFVTEGMGRLGAEIFFHKVAMRPGKPLLFAKMPDGPVVFGLPGNPVSGVVALRFFVGPYLREASGLRPERPLRARLTADVKKPSGFRCFFKARLSVGDAGPRVTVLPGQMSFLVRPLLEATAWAVLPEDHTEVTGGSLVDVYPIHFSDHDWQEETVTAT